MIDNPEIKNILRHYQTLLTSVDQWFSRCKESFEGQIHCAAGCAACCRGLFDITLLDAFLLQSGFNRLSPERQKTVRAKAEKRLRQLQSDWSGFQHPYLLNHLPDELWTEMPEDDRVPCPLLGEDGACLVYEHRPMICRTHGLPNIDDSGESFSDLYCTLNFDGIDPLSLDKLRWSFRRVYAQEFDLLALFNQQLLGSPLREADTFIPLALLIDFPALAADPSLVLSR
ncbi:YkgJ family cysteine cluster protein [Syntrophotalea acetylenivorans]|uniref:YkgJ family cysteine cluster protein n=1 Tax=Syntrophotalea acetylenivorans TaxID=1842532 RepID=UPI000AA16494|nr:YkgJ family cysteine cluster protein [Syntrophotalea acetylenivorans]